MAISHKSLRSRVTQKQVVMDLIPGRSLALSRSRPADRELGGRLLCEPCRPIPVLPCPGRRLDGRAAGNV
ncbi:hypothetical protein WJX84_011579 [Apatococcus fuscideae]|uniref:Uncharacterized protein n=1 Tax=Apatococcus fuscideae TaxID=2026836 RepID=A0AAW1T4F0_9CHLO